MIYMLNGPVPSTVADQYQGMVVMILLILRESVVNFSSSFDPYIHISFQLFLFLSFLSPFIFIEGMVK